MSKIYIPTTSAEQWKQFLADPEKHWQRGYSARTLANCWQEANGFPDEIKETLSGSPYFQDIEMLLAIPEYQVSLPGGSRPSQNDIWVLARAGSNLVSIAVEGKVSESFGPTIQEWHMDSSPGKDKRLAYLCNELGLVSPLSDGLRYQLLHRTVSAIIEAKRFNASQAVMLVHSFSQSDECFQDYADFVSLFGGIGSVNRLVSIGVRGTVSLHFAWVRGNATFLKK
jgi:hypothetical protein